MKRKFREVGGWWQLVRCTKKQKKLSIKDSLTKFEKRGPYIYVSLVSKEICREGRQVI